MRKSNPNKDQTICIRVSGEEKRKIREKAARESKSTSEYMADAAMAGLERRSSRKRKRIMQMVKNQETLNELFILMKEKEADRELFEKLMELVEEENRLWQC